MRGGGSIYPAEINSKTTGGVDALERSFAAFFCRNNQAAPAPATDPSRVDTASRAPTIDGGRLARSPGSPTAWTLVGNVCSGEARETDQSDAEQTNYHQN